MSSIMGVLFATLIALMIIPQLAGVQSRGLEATQMAATGQQFTQVMDAAQAYVQAHTNTLQTMIPVGGTSSVSIANLQGDNLLPASFSNSNPFGQSWLIQVNQSSTGNLQTLVTSNSGTAMTGRQEAAIAALAGARGGFVPYNGMFTAGSSSNVAQGSFGDWSLNLGSFSNPGSGHLAGLLSFNNGTLQNDYLYRVGVPGHPELNTMTVGLNMGTNSISNANDVQANTATLGSGNVNGRPGALQIGAGYIYGDGTNIATRQNGDLYSQHTDGSLAGIDASDGHFSAKVGTNGYDPESGYPNGWAGGVHAYDVFAEGSLGTGKDASGNVLTQFSPSGDGTVGRNLTVNGIETIGTEIRLAANATSGAACSPNGALRGNALGNGQLMVCFNGVWRSSNTAGTATVYTLPNTPGNYDGDATGLNLGAHFFCAITSTFEENSSDPNSKPNASRVLPVSTDSSGRTIWVLSRGDQGTLGGSAVCIDY